MTIACIVQARMGSTRLPGKVLKDIAGRPMLVFLLERLSVLDVDHLVVATSEAPADDPVAEVATAVGAKVVRGSASNVLSRYVAALAQYPADHVVRITGDCPIVDPGVISTAVQQHLDHDADYTSNTLIRTFPDGLDVEVVRGEALLSAASESPDGPEREHVTPFLYRRPERFRLAAFRSGDLLGSERWTVDTEEDLTFIRDLVSRLGRVQFRWEEALAATGRRAIPGDALVLRPVTGGDAQLLLEWRNDPAAVNFSQSGRSVGAEEHRRWFARRVDDPGSRIWIAEVAGVPVGQVRVDVEGSRGTVSIAVAPNERGRGYGTHTLTALQQALRADHQVTALLAHIHPANVASIKAFAAAGFRPDDDGVGSGFRRLRWDRA